MRKTREQAVGRGVSRHRGVRLGWSVGSADWEEQPEEEGRVQWGPWVGSAA